MITSFYSSMIKENYTFPTKHNIELEVKREKDMSLYREGYRSLKIFSKFRTKNVKTKLSDEET